MEFTKENFERLEKSIKLRNILFLIILLFLSLTIFLLFVQGQTIIFYKDSFNSLSDLNNEMCNLCNSILDISNDYKQLYYSEIGLEYEEILDEIRCFSIKL